MWVMFDMLFVRNINVESSKFMYGGLFPDNQPVVLPFLFNETGFWTVFVAFLIYKNIEITN